MSTRSNADPPSSPSAGAGRTTRRRARAAMRRARLPLLGLTMISLIATALFFIDSSAQPAYAQGYDANCAALPSDAVTPQLVTQWRDGLDSSATAGINRFNRVLERFGVDTATNASPMTTNQAESVSRWLNNNRWDRIARTMAALDNCGATPPPPPPVPAISISPGSDITEGAIATFTLTANPAPSAHLDVSVNVSQSGDFATRTGPHTVTFTASGRATFRVATRDDTVDEPNGYLTTTVTTGAGYTVAATSSATLSVADNDVTPQNDDHDTQQDDDDTSSSCLPADAVTAAEVTAWRDALDPVSAAAGIRRFNRVLEALGVDTNSDQNAMTYHEGRAIDDRIQNNRWDRISRTLTAIQRDNCAAAPTTTSANPQVSISAGSDITEGADAVFTLTASPAPSADLNVSVTVSQSGRYITAGGTRTVTIPASGSATLRVPTIDDSTDEPDGLVAVLVNAGTAYDVSSSRGSTALFVSDDDDDDTTVITPPASQCVESLNSDGEVSGTWATDCQSDEPGRGYARYYTFTLAQQAYVKIYLESSIDAYLYLRRGDAVTSGSTSHHDDDGGRGTDARIADTLAAGTYTIEATTYSSGRTGAFTLEVNGLNTSLTPAAKPEVSITAGSDVTEGGTAYFTVTASFAPRTALSVKVTVDQTGDLAAGIGSDTVTIPPGRTSGRLRIYTINDSTDEPDGSVEVSINAGTGYDISPSQSSASVTVRDDDEDLNGKSSNCVNTLSSDGEVSGAWTAKCQSAQPYRGYAQYYTFTLSAQSHVSIDLKSTVDTYLYLRTGDKATSSSPSHSNDDGGRGTNSQITDTLAPGTYTIEATTYRAGNKAPFTLEITGLNQPTP